MMKANKIHFLKFTKSINIGDGDDFTHPIYTDLSNCLNEDDQQFLGFTENDDIFIRLNDYKVESFSNVFSKHGFEFDSIDVTNDVIKGNIQKMYPEVEDLFEDFRLDCTSVDDVLDKISFYGIDSLDIIDKKVLGKF